MVVIALPADSTLLALGEHPTFEELSEARHELTVVGAG